MENLRIGTLFSGIGAPEEALKNIKIKHSIEFACEIDNYARKTYIENHTCKKFYKDIFDINNPPEIDLLIFGFPCQLFSIARRKITIQEKRQRLNYFKKAIEILIKSKAKVFIAENVKGLTSNTNKTIFKKILKLIKDADYNVSYSILNSLDFQVPQNRERIWFIENKIPFPENTIKRITLDKILEKNVNPKYFINDDRIIEIKKTKRIPNYNKDYSGCLTETVARKGSSSEYLSYISAIKKFTGKYRNYTPRECARLQGFSDNFIIPVSDTQAYKQFANSMTVLILEYILKGIYMNDNGQ